MNRRTPVAVCSRSFSAHPVLRHELSRHFDNIRFNDEGLSLRGAALIDFLRDRAAVIVGMETIDGALLDAVPSLRAVAKYGVGLDRIDQDALSARGIEFRWTAGVNRNAVAELTIAFILALLREVPRSHTEIHRGQWRQIRGKELGSSTVGILGCGHIGKRVATLCRAFGARVLAHDLLDFPDFYSQHTVEPVSLDQLIAESDVLTLHTPLDASTRNILSADRLTKMRPQAVVVNTARGGLIDEHALFAALRSSTIAGAALDVFETEPPIDHPLLTLDNVLTTGHIGGHTEDSIVAMGRAAIAGLVNT